MEATVNFFLKPQDQEASIQIRRATSSQWAADNPVLLDGELGVDTTTGLIRVGNGVDRWSSLVPQAQLTDSVTNTSTTIGASALAVKTAYDHASAAIRPTIIDAKGDLISGSAADTPAVVSIGSNNAVLTADSSAFAGMSWKTSLQPSTISVAGAATFDGASTFNGSSSFNGSANFQELSEKLVLVSVVSNAVTLDWTAGNVFFAATVGATGNMTFNATNVPVESNTIKTINVMITQGTTGYIPTVFNINGSPVTIRWADGQAPTPTSSSGKVDIFIISMIRYQALNWFVYASVAKNF